MTTDFSGREIQELRNIRIIKTEFDTSTTSSLKMVLLELVRGLAINVMKQTFDSWEV